tara:strand:- start:14106 stop:14609 length:504 start_codon:yes stop_codon:yes gene_type:complete
MSLSDFTVRISGTVAYSDRSHGSFEASAIWKGNLGGVVAQHSNPDSLEHFRRLAESKSVELADTLAVLAPAGSPQGIVTFATLPAPVTSKTVTSFVMEVSGLITDDDNSKDGFSAQWVNGAVNLFPDDTEVVWQTLTDPASNPLGDQRSFLVMVFDAVAGSGETTLS